MSAGVSVVVAVLLVVCCTACTPECRFSCNDPICTAHCVPVCKPANCTVQCADESAVCSELSCRVVCPNVTDMCPADSAPSCETHCDAVQCTGECSPLCEATECTWACVEPPDCDSPKCQLMCERPAAEYDGEVVCTAGYVYNATSLTCTSCPDGTYSAYNYSTTCGTCEDGYMPTDDKTGCIAETTFNLYYWLTLFAPLIAAAGLSLVVVVIYGVRKCLSRNDNAIRLPNDRTEIEAQPLFRS